MIRTDAGMVCPRREGTQVGAQHHPREGEDGRNEGASPSTAQVGEFRNRLGKQDLIGVTLKVAQDRSPEDRSNDDDAKQRRANIVVSVGEGSIEKNLAIAVANRAEALGGNVEKGKRDPDGEVNVGGEALEAELELEGEEFPKLRHVRSSRFEKLIRQLTLGLLRQVEEVDVFQSGVDRTETIALRGFCVDANLVLSANQVRGDDVKLGFDGSHLVVRGHHFGPDLAV